MLNTCWNFADAFVRKIKRKVKGKVAGRIPAPARHLGVALASKLRGEESTSRDHLNCQTGNYTYSIFVRPRDKNSKEKIESN